jgi:hypothetical protein
MSGARVAAVIACLGAVACHSQPMAQIAPGWRTTPTYYDDVAPILNVRCVRCHQPEQLAPFSMLAVDDVIANAAQIADAVSNGRMPPMPATANDDCPEIDDPRVMPDDERDVVLRWIYNGKPLGDPRPALPLPSIYGPLGPATLHYPMPARYLAPTDRSQDVYRCFVIDPAITSVVPIVAMSVQPGNPTIVHHATVFSLPPGAAAQAKALDDADDAPGYDCFGGVGVAEAYASGAWVPGMTPVPPPRAGLGAWLFPGWLFVLQVHYNFSNAQTAPGDPLGDQSDVLVWRATQPVTEVPAAMVLGDWTIELPAGQSDIVRSVNGDVIPVGQPAALGQVQAGLIYEAWGHEHLLGKAFHMDLVHADGTSQCLLHIPRWDFHWQGLYPFKQPVATQAGDKVRVTCEWDNSAAMYPPGVAPHDVFYGETTADEMCLGTLAVMHD